MSGGDGVLTDEAAVVFDDLRPYLHGVAYRLTSSWADAEDVVADAWSRWSGRADEIDDPRAWLTRVVARLAVDHLRSARVRREAYVGPWLPEPLITSPGSSTGSVDPLDELIRDESVRLAFLVVLDRLTPEQRVAVVLHDVLGLPFVDVAEVLGTSVEAARQHASRGRRRIESDGPPPRPSPDRAWALLGELAVALQDGDAARLATLLAPDVAFVSDGAGEVSAAGRPLTGPDEVSRFILGLVGLANRHGVQFGFEPVLVNGEPGFVSRFDSPRPRDPRLAVYAYVVRDDQIAAVYAVLAPAKLTRVPPPTALPPASTSLPS